MQYRVELTSTHSTTYLDKHIGGYRIDIVEAAGFVVDRSGALEFYVKGELEQPVGGFGTIYFTPSTTFKVYAPGTWHAVTLVPALRPEPLPETQTGQSESSPPHDSSSRDPEQPPWDPALTDPWW